MASTQPPSAVPRALHQPSPLSQPPTSQSQNAGPHLLSLKVMRASAPSLAVSEKPYYDDAGSASFDGLIKAVGKGIEDGLSHDLLSNRWEGSSRTSAVDTFPISNLLVLPNSFGTLYLGETFRTYLCVRNDSNISVREPSLRVEMQVGASDPQQQQASGPNDGGVRWHQLAHLILPQPTRFSPEPEAGQSTETEGKPVWELSPNQPLETSLGYDIKDLGPHVLVCTVGYKSPILQENGETAWVERSFRKFYKFSVDRSPISVRTKVHQPRHASSLFHPDERIRKRVELEVQVQNVTGNGASLVFNGLMLKPAPGWKWRSIDRPSLTNTDKEGEGQQDMWIGKGSNDLLADGDIRQYLFSLYPSSALSLGQEALKRAIDMGTSPEGHVIRGDPLGHLDISWRMSLGEPGRLQTSQLVRRRVALPPVSVAPPSTVLKAVPPQLKTQLTLLPGALATLQNVKAGSEVELGVKLDLCDLSAQLLPPIPNAQGRETGAEGAGNRQGAEGAALDDDDDDDDTPLSEFSPRTPRSVNNTAKEDGKEVTVIREFNLALQHCSISPPSPSNFAPTSSLSSTQTPSAATLADAQESGPLTPRKTPLPSRTSTPTQTQSSSGVGALNKSRLQANLSNLVRNTSLSLRPRGSVDVGSEDSGGNSRVGTPVPPAVPPKNTNPAAATATATAMGLAPAAPIVESALPSSSSSHTVVGQAEERPKSLPEPSLSWNTVANLNGEYVENHAQALTRPPSSTNGGPGQVTIPTTFLPTPELVRFHGSSLIPLPPVQLRLKVWKPSTGQSVYRARPPPQQRTPETPGTQEGEANENEASVQTNLKYTIQQPPPPPSSTSSQQPHREAAAAGAEADLPTILRFGALRILLLSYTDAEEGKDAKEAGETHRTITVLQEIPVLAETLLLNTTNTNNVHHR